MAVSHRTRSALPASMLGDVSSLRALSIRQPAAARILAGEKTLEFRTWRTSYRGPLLIHAPRQFDAEASHLPRGGLVGSAILADVQGRPGAYRWLLNDPRPLRRIIPCRGRLGLFPLPQRVVNRLLIELRTRTFTPAQLAKSIKRLPEYQPVASAVDSSGPWKSQKQHWLTWLHSYNGPGHYGRACWDRDAAFVYNHIRCAAMLLWLAEASGLSGAVVLHSKHVIQKSSNEGAACAAIRRVVPWDRIQEKLAAKRGRRRSS